MGGVHLASEAVLREYHGIPVPTGIVEPEIDSDGWRICEPAPRAGAEPI